MKASSLMRWPAKLPAVVVRRVAVVRRVDRGIVVVAVGAVVAVPVAVSITVAGVGRLGGDEQARAQDHGRDGNQLQQTIHGISPLSIEGPSCVRLGAR